MQVVILDIVVIKYTQSRSGVVDAVICGIQRFQPKVVRLDGTQLIIGAVGDLGDTVDALVCGIGDQDRQQVHFILAAFGGHAQHVLKVVNKSGILIHHAQDIGDSDCPHLLEERIVHQMFFAGGR